MAKKVSSKQVEDIAKRIVKRDEQIENIAKRLTSQNDKAVSDAAKKEGRK